MTILTIIGCLLGAVLLLLLASLVHTLFIPVRKSSYEPAPDSERAMVTL